MGLEPTTAWTTMRVAEPKTWLCSKRLVSWARQWPSCLRGPEACNRAGYEHGMDT
jgi:hypothetical protein